MPAESQRVIRAGLLVCTAALGSCAHVPPATPPEAILAPHVEHTFDDPAVLATWRALDAAATQPSATLNAGESFAAALNFNPQMALARAQIEAGQAGVMLAKQRPNPVLALTPEHLINAVANGVSPWVVAISLVWPVRTAGKRALAIDQALAASDANLLTAANVVWNLRAAVRGATCALELASEKSVLAHEEWDLRIDLAARLEKQADAGVVSRYESARARLDRDGAAQRFRMSAAELNAARHDLAAVTGVPFAEIERRAIGQTCLASQSLRSTEAQAAAAATAVAARLDVRAKLAEFRAADAAWRSEIARRTPDLNLGPGYTYDQGDRKINFTVSGELPIFSHNDGPIARARADRNRVIAEAEILQRAVLDGVERARDQLSAAEAGYTAALDAATQTEQILNRDITRQQQGELDQPAVVVSRIALDVARTDVLVAQRLLSDAVAAFEAAAQAPLAPPLFDGEAAQALLNAPANAAAGDTHK